LTAAELIPEMVKMGISGWTRIDCHGAGRSGLEGGLAEEWCQQCTTDGCKYAGKRGKTGGNRNPHA
ncbi:hypothetical protein E3A20_29920, partial [Planctomyces bekefii]